jgi:hypothetical protein
MLDDLHLRGFSPRTQEAYVCAAHQLAAYFHRAPDELGEVADDQATKRFRCQCVATLN